jgi:hypothetical protein
LYYILPDSGDIGEEEEGEYSSGNTECAERHATISELLANIPLTIAASFLDESCRIEVKQVLMKG